MLEIPPELLALPPFALAAGVDLYLTLLFLGAAPTTGLWETPLPGALGDLDSPQVLIMVGTFYLLEFAAERFPPAALVWNAFHAIIRPVSGMLLALLLLDGQPIGLVIAGSVLGGALASLGHAVRSGGAVIRWFGTASAPHVLLVSLLEDAFVLGTVSWTLDAPRWAFFGALTLLVVLSPIAPSQVRAFVFAIRLAIGRVLQRLRQRKWLGPDELPEWVRRSLDDDDLFAPGGALRGSPVGAYRLPGAPGFVMGWVVVRGGTPVFVHRRFGAGVRVDLGPLGAEGIFESGFFRRLDLRDPAGRASRVFFGLNGPSAESLTAEFLSA